MSPQSLSPARRTLFMLALIVAAECVFALPFVIARVFRPTLLDVFAITNLQLGTAFSLYGVVAMISYVPGGPLADRFSARTMMTVALLTTAVGGTYFASVPDIDGLKVLFGFWGLSTVLLFWAALIRATREWGGRGSQGTAYGLLDGGRGLFAAVLASASVAVFAALLPADAADATLADKTAALQQIIWVFTAMTAGGAAFVWLAIPPAAASDDTEPDDSEGFQLSQVTTVLRMPAVWLQGLIVICAYVGFKGTDDFGLYARDAFNFDDVQAAHISTISFWVRPVAALAAGLLGDRLGSSRMILFLFGALVVGDLAVASGMLQPNLPWMLFTAVIYASAAIYGLRGLYFALFPEAKVPLALTGTAVGIVSVIGYTPDIFMGPLMGYLTDRSPGALGHQHLFGVLAVFSLVGMLATAAFMAITRPAAEAP